MMYLGSAKQWRGTIIFPAAAICWLVLLAGCHSRQPSSTASDQVRAYPVTGIVVSTNPEKGEVTVDTDAVPGFMQAMIMPYHLAQPADIATLHPGDHISARLQVSGSRTLLDQIHVTGHGRKIYAPPVIYNQPKLGQQVPNFSFVNQDGHTIHLDQFRGRAVLMTFIYTRCPLPDYCLRMSRNFAEIHRRLLAHPSLYRETQLLTVSFDPTHDLPRVLRQYGEGYIGKTSSGNAFEHWDFAAPSEAELKQVEEFFGVAVAPGPENTLNHSLSTVLIGRDGKIAGWYPGNTWNPEEVLKVLEQAAG